MVAPVVSVTVVVRLAPGVKVPPLKAQGELTAFYGRCVAVMRRAVDSWAGSSDACEVLMMRLLLWSKPKKTRCRREAFVPSLKTISRSG